MTFVRMTFVRMRRYGSPDMFTLGDIDDVLAQCQRVRCEGGADFSSEAQSESPRRPAATQSARRAQRARAPPNVLVSVRHRTRTREVMLQQGGVIRSPRALGSHAALFGNGLLPARAMSAQSSYAVAAARPCLSHRAPERVPAWCAPARPADHTQPLLASSGWQ